ncbi:hypothetical protein H5410_028038 [Solanum commersonii]|uniref:Uncharacterized protein n=1 Tax=Solanum commersonii TaxID=4109 RepID=A0A9J5Z1J1_SOLCO|nr:hypothetical protein H5410_028038 [Solanum commersonii]
MAFDKRLHFWTLSNTFLGVPKSSVTLEFRQHFSSIALSATLKSRPFKFDHLHFPTHLEFTTNQIATIIEEAKSSRFHIAQ